MSSGAEEIIFMPIEDEEHVLDVDSLEKYGKLMEFIINATVQMQRQNPNKRIWVIYGAGESE